MTDYFKATLFITATFTLALFLPWSYFNYKAETTAIVGLITFLFCVKTVKEDW